MRLVYRVRTMTLPQAMRQRSYHLQPRHRTRTEYVTSPELVTVITSWPAADAPSRAGKHPLAERARQEMFGPVVFSLDIPEV